jgi:cytochrome c-type biogenesis protein CcmE
MYKKKLTIIVSSIVLLIAAILVYSNYSKVGTSATKKSEIKLVDVDKVVENPEKFDGLVNVEGTVTEVSNDKKFFTLGCEDECINLPVSYKGDLPKLESNIIALGEVRKDVDGKFFFDAKEIQYK